MSTRQTHKELKFQWTAIWEGLHYAKIVLNGVYYRRNGNWQTEQEAAAYANAMNSHYRPGVVERNDVDPALDSAAAKLFIADLAAGRVKTGYIAGDNSAAPATPASLAKLRQVAIKAANEAAIAANKTTRLRTVRRREKAVRNYAKARANGVCEACGEPAPFLTAVGPFLEVHHIDNLADESPERVDRVAAVCPNCHRRCHYSVDGLPYNAALGNKIAAKEAEAEQSGVAGHASTKHA